MTDIICPDCGHPVHRHGPIVCGCLVPEGVCACTLYQVYERATLRAERDRYRAALTKIANQEAREEEDWIDEFQEIARAALKDGSS